MIAARIADATKEAMKAGDKARLQTLRTLGAAVKNAEIEARGTGKALSEEALMALLQKLVKQRQEAADLYDKGGRADLAGAERGEIAVLETFLPAQMDEAAVTAAIAEAIAETGASSVKDMGKVMAALKARHTGTMDFAKASAAVKAALG